MESAILLSLGLSFVPYAPQAVRVSYAYQALQSSWRTLFQVMHIITSKVDNLYTQRVLEKGTALGKTLEEALEKHVWKPKENRREAEREEEKGRAPKSRLTCTLWWSCWREVMERGDVEVNWSSGRKLDGNGEVEQEGNILHRTTVPAIFPGPSTSSIEAIPMTSSFILSPFRLDSRIQEAVQLRCLHPFAHGNYTERSATSHQKAEAWKEETLPPYTPGPSPWYDHLPLFDDEEEKDSVMSTLCGSLLGLNHEVNDPHGKSGESHTSFIPAAAGDSFSSLSYDACTVRRLHLLWQMFLRYAEPIEEEGVKGGGLSEPTEAAPFLKRDGIPISPIVPRHGHTKEKPFLLPTLFALVQNQRGSSFSSHSSSRRHRLVPTVTLPVHPPESLLPDIPLSLLELPRRVIRGEFGSFRAFLRYHLDTATRMEQNLAKKKIMGTRGKGEAWESDATDGSKENRCGFVSNTGVGMASTWEKSVSCLHPFVFSGLRLSHDGLFVTRAASRVDAGVCFSVFYSLLPSSPLSGSSLGGPLRMARGRVGGRLPPLRPSEGTPRPGPTIRTGLLGGCEGATGSEGEGASIARGTPWTAVETRDDGERISPFGDGDYHPNEDEAIAYDEEEEDTTDPRTAFCARALSRRRGRRSGVGAPSFSACQDGSHGLGWPKGKHEVEEDTVDKNSPALLFCCRPLEEVESLLESYLPIFPPLARHETVERGTANMNVSSSRVPDEGMPEEKKRQEEVTHSSGDSQEATSSSSSPPPPPQTNAPQPSKDITPILSTEQHRSTSTPSTASTNIFTPEMLLPLLPSYFIPLHLLGPRLPAGYTPTHVRELFGRMVKHVEMVSLPPLPPTPSSPPSSMSIPSCREGNSGVYLRLHEGLKESSERVVDFTNEKNKAEVMEVHQAEDYVAYRPDPFLANAFRALFIVPASRTTLPTHPHSHSPNSGRGPHKSDGTSVAARPSSASSAPPFSRVIHNEWLPLRDVVERAPAHLRDSLLPLRASHTLLFFAQMQHLFQFSPENGGLIRLAGNWGFTEAQRPTDWFYSNHLTSTSWCSSLLGLIPLPSSTTSQDGLTATATTSPGLPAPMRVASGVVTTGLGRHNTPTPLAVSEVAALLQQQGCVYVMDMESARTAVMEGNRKHQSVGWWDEAYLLALAKGRGGMSGGATGTQEEGRPIALSHWSLNAHRQCLLLDYMMNMEEVLDALDEVDDVSLEFTSNKDRSGDQPIPQRTALGGSSARRVGGTGRRTPRSSNHGSALFLSDSTKREILAYYGSLRQFLACHHGEVFSLRLAPPSQEELLSSSGPSSLPIAEVELQHGEAKDAGGVVSPKIAASRTPLPGSGFSNTNLTEEADWAHQLPTEALLLSHTSTMMHGCPANEGSCGEPHDGTRVTTPLTSPRLMVELWSKFEERQASSSAMAAANGTGVAGMGNLSYGSSSTAFSSGNATAAPSRAASSSPFLSSAAFSALTLEQQLEYAISIHDRRRIQKARRQLAQRNNPETAYTDPEILFEALLRYVPLTRHVSLRFLLRHLPSTITDFLPSNVTTWLKRFENQGKIQVFEFKFRHHIHLLRPGLPLPDGALRKTFSDDELVRIVAGDIQQRDPRPSRMAFLYGLLPLGAKEVIRTKYKTLQTFLTRYPEHFLIIAESKSERSSIVRLLQPPPPLPLDDRGAGGGETMDYSQPFGSFAGEVTEKDLEKEEEDEKEMMMRELDAELKESMRWG